MRERWQNLSQRERVLVSLIAIIVGLWVLYRIIWFPLYHLNQRTYQDIQSKNNMIHLLETMQGSPLIKRVTQSSPIQLLPTVQQSIQQANLSGSLTSISQTNSQTLQLSFQQVAVTSWLKWLQSLMSTSPVAIDTWQATRTSDGIANIELTLIQR